MWGGARRHGGRRAFVWPAEIDVEGRKGTRRWVDAAGDLRYSYLDGACVWGVGERGRWTHLENRWAALGGVPDGLGDLSDHSVCCFRRGASRRAIQSEGRPKAVPIKLAPTTKAQRSALTKLEDITRGREFLWATGSIVCR